MQSRGNYPLGTVFQGNQLIRTFPELEMFTSFITCTTAIFKNSSIVSFLVPRNMVSVRDWFINDAPNINMDKLEFPASMSILRNLIARGYIGKVVINSNLTQFIAGYMYGRSIKGSTCFTYVFNVTEVVPLTDTQNANKHWYYVPDELVAAFKAANNWSTVASRILPISELPD